MIHFERRLDQACAELASAGKGERDNETFRLAAHVGAALGWAGACKFTAETRLTDASPLPRREALGTVKRGIKKGLRGRPHTEPRTRDKDAILIKPRREYRSTPHVATKKRADLASVWDSLKPVSSDPEIVAWLKRRGIDPGIVERADLARVLPADTPIDALPHRAMKRMGVTWVESGHRLIFRVFDVNGRLVNLKARADIPDDAPEKAKKSLNLALGEGSCSAAIEACATVQALLDGRAYAVEAIKRRGLVVVEGEWDYLTHAQRTDGPVVIGLWSGAWTQAIADRIPDGTNVYLRPHNDKAGHRYMRKVAESLYGRCNVYAPPLPLWDGDDNDRLQAGTLPAHPADDSAPYFVERHGGRTPAIIPDDKKTARQKLHKLCDGLRGTIADPEEHGRKVLLWGNTGVGKTYATRRTLAIRAWCDGHTVRWAAPTDRLAAGETKQLLLADAKQLHSAGEMSAADWRAFKDEMAGAVDTGRNRRNCKEYDRSVLPASRATQGGGGIVCRACPFAAECSTEPKGWRRRQKARRNIGAGRFSITTHAMEVQNGENGDPVDLLIIDEDPSGALLTEQAFSAGDLASWLEAGDLGDIDRATYDRLCGVIADSEAEGAKPTKLDPSILDGVKLGTTHNASKAIREQLKKDPDLHNFTFKAVKKSPPFRALEALRDSARHGFAGCRVEHGTVVVQRRQRLQREAHTTVFLDATTTSRRARALLGHDLKIHAVKCEEAHAVKVIHLIAEQAGRAWAPSKWNLSPEALTRPEGDDTSDKRNPPGKVTWERINAVGEAHVGHGDEARDTLIVTTKPVFDMLKAMGDNAPPWFKRAHKAERVIYFNQAGAVGSDIYKACSTVVVLPYWVPGAVKGSRAEVLSSMSGVELKADGWTEENPSGGWAGEATYELEVSRIVQAVGRARGRTELIILGGRRTFGFTPNETTHVDLYAWRECNGPFAAAACLNELTRLVVDSRGGCTVLSAKSIGVSHGAMSSPNIYMGVTYHLGIPTIEQVNHALANAYRGCAESWAWNSGLGSIKVLTDQGFKRLAFTAEHELVDTPEGKRPTTETIRRSLLAYAPGLKWFEIPDTRERVQTADPIAPYDEAITELARTGEELTRSGLQRLTGISRSTVARHAKQHRTAFHERYRLAVEEASKPRKVWSPPKVQTVELRARARSRVRDRVPPKWLTFLQENGYLIGQLPTSRGAPPQWKPPRATRVSAQPHA